MSSTTSAGPSPTASAASSTDGDVPNTASSMIAASFATWGIAAIFLILRLWTRARIVRAFGAADWCITISGLFALGLSIAIVKETEHGMGKHVQDIDVPVEFPKMLYAWWWSLLCYTNTLFLTKVSICLLYLSIFTFEWAKRACYAVLGIVIASNIWALVSTFTYAIPLAATWDPTVIATYTTSQDIWWAITGFALATDALIFLLPIPLVLPLKLPRREKMVVVGIFTLGFFTCFVSFTRLVILVQEKGKIDPDFTYNGTNLTYWTVIEVNTAIVVSCLMTLKPLVSKFFPGVLDSRNSESSSSAVSSDRPPLTIGSRPSRNPLAPANRDSWMEIAGHRETPGERILRDMDIEAGDPDRDFATVHTAPSATTGSGEDFSEKDEINMVEVRPFGLTHPPLRGNYASSERTQDLEPVASAKSLG